MRKQDQLSTAEGWNLQMATWVHTSAGRSPNWINRANTGCNQETGNRLFFALIHPFTGMQSGNTSTISVNSEAVILPRDGILPSTWMMAYATPEEDTGMYGEVGMMPVMYVSHWEVMP